MSKKASNLQGQSDLPPPLRGKCPYGPANGFPAICTKPNQHHVDSRSACERVYNNYSMFCFFILQLHPKIFAKNACKTITELQYTKKFGAGRERKHNFKIFKKVLILFFQRIIRGTHINQHLVVFPPLWITSCSLLGMLFTRLRRTWLVTVRYGCTSLNMGQMKSFCHKTMIFCLIQPGTHLYPAPLTPGVQREIQRSGMHRSTGTEFFRKLYCFAN